MSAIPVWLTGPGGGYTVTMTPQTPGSTGTLTAGTLVTMTPSIDKITVSYKPVTEEISPMTSGRSNNVKLQSATSINLTEILKSNGVNLLAAAVATYDYFVISIARGGQSWAFTGLCDGYDEDLNRGKSTGTASFIMVDISGPNPVYA